MTDESIQSTNTGSGCALLQGDEQGQRLALFAVQGDVPFKQAFSELSVMLGCIRHLTTEAEMENDRQAGECGAHSQRFGQSTDRRYGVGTAQGSDHALTMSAHLGGTLRWAGRRLGQPQII